MHKKIVSIMLVVIIMMSALSGVNVYAEGEPEIVGGDETVTKEIADQIISEMFGDVTEVRETQDAYEYVLPQEFTDTLLDQLNDEVHNSDVRQETDNDLEIKGQIGGVTNGTNPDELPEDWIDTSNEVLESFLNKPPISVRSAFFDESEREKVDVVFIIDHSGSMGSYIANVKRYAATFANYLGNQNLTVRFGLIDYSDYSTSNTTETHVHTVNGSPWLSVEDFTNQLSTITIRGGAECPIDAMGFLTDDTTMFWSSDAYKFAVLITDEGYYISNRHGISNMQDMVDRLADRDIYTSVITLTGLYNTYGILPTSTGGILMNINTNYAETLQAYADSIIGATSVKASYSIRVTNELGYPVQGVMVSHDEGLATTNAYGIVIFESDTNIFTDLTVSKAGYESIQYTSIELENETTISIKLRIDENEIDTSDPSIPRFSKDMLVNPPSGSVTIQGPSINILGSNIILFSLAADMSNNFFQATSISFDHKPTEKKFEIIIGMDGQNPKDEPSKKEWDQAYKVYKSLAKNFTDKSGKQIYNEFRAMKKSKKSQYKFLQKVDGYVGGYLEITYADQKGEDWLQGLEGGLVVAMEMKSRTLFETPLPPPVSWIFISLEFGFDLEGKLVIAQIKKEGKTQFGFFNNASLAAKPELTMKATAGIPNIANVYGGLGGTLEIKTVFPWHSMRESFEAKLFAFFKLGLKFFFYEIDYKHNFADLVLWPRSTRSINAIQTSSGIEIIPRNYTTLPLKYSSSNSFVKSTNILSTEDSTRSALNTISISGIPFVELRNDSDIFPVAAPKLIQLDDNRLLLIWITDDSSRTVSNHTAVVYSIYDGTWTTPIVIDNDGTSDFASSAFKASDGKVHVVWQDSDTIFGTDDIQLEDLTKTIDVSYAVFDPVTNMFNIPVVVSESNNEILELLPQVSVNSDSTSASIVWLENNDNHTFMFEGTNSVMRRTYVNGSANQIETLASNLPLVTNLASAYQGNTNYAVYTTATWDESVSNFTHNGQINMFGTSASSFSGLDGFEEIMTISDLQFVGETLYWSTETGINSSTNLASINNVTDYMVSGFKIYQNARGECALVCVVSDGINDNLYAAYEDSGVWGLPTPLAELKNVSLNGLNGFYDSSSDGLVLAYNRTEVLEDAFGKTDLIVANYERKAVNLEVMPEAYYSVYDMAPGGDLDIWADVVNKGATDSVDLQAKLYVDGNLVKTVTELYTINDEDERVPLQNIKAGESVSIIVPYILPDPINISRLEIEFVSADGSTLGTLNKKAVAEFKKVADLEVININVERTSSGAKLTADIRNIGDIIAENVEVSLYNEEGYVLETSLGLQNLGSLAPSDYREVSFDIASDDTVVATEFSFKRFIVEAVTDTDEIWLDNNSNDALLGAVLPDSVVLSDKVITLTSGETYEFTAEVIPSDAVQKAVTWHSSNLNVADIDENGKVTAKRTGMATIRAITVDGMKTDAATVIVVSGTVAVKSVEITQKDIILQINESQTLTATITPENASNKTIKWYSNNPLVASIDGTTGVITGVSQGSTKISVVTVDGGYSALADVTVLDSEVMQKLSTPQGLTFGDFIARWGNVENANGYDVHLLKDNVKIESYTVYGTSYNFEKDIKQYGDGAYVFTVGAIGDGTQYTNSEMSNVSNEFVYNENQLNPPNKIKITTNSLPNGVVGTKYNSNIIVTDKGVITYKITNGTLPKGLMLNNTTGLISGTPTEAGKYTFTVKVSNSKTTDSKELSININNIRQESSLISVIPIYGVSKHTIIFENTGDTKITSQIVEHGDKVVQPDDPVREGYKFMGWYYDSNHLVKYNFNKRVTIDITLYAKWKSV